MGKQGMAARRRQWGAGLLMNYLTQRRRGAEEYKRKEKKEKRRKEDGSSYFFPSSLFPLPSAPPRAPREAFFVLFLLLSTVLYAQQPRVLVQAAPDNPVEGSTLTLTLFTDHDNPDEVNVLAPPFTDGILLDFMLKGPRAVNGDFERWTAIEFRFTLTGYGTVTFEPFTIITPRGRTQTDTFSVNVEKAPGGGAGGAGNGETTLFRLSWENAPANLKIGETAIIALRVNNWKNTAVLPASGLFLPPVPMGHIIESIPLSEKEKSGGIAIKLRIIPLQAGVLTVINRRLTIGNAIYEVPALRIPVRAARTEPQ